jgi:hypothetical protein
MSLAKRLFAWDAGSGQQTVIRYSFRPPMRPQIIALKALYENRGKAIHANQTAKGVGGVPFTNSATLGLLGTYLVPHVGKILIGSRALKTESKHGFRFLKTIQAA